MKVDITTTVTVDLIGFPVPNYIVGKDVHGNERNIELCRVPTDQLSQLCEDWRQAVFDKAARKDKSP